MVFKKFITAIVLLVAAVLLNACASSKSVKEQLLKRPATLDYLIDGPATTFKTDLKIFIEEVEAPSNTATLNGSVEKGKGSFVPLIFYTKISQDYIYQLDRKGILESPESFLREGFIREAQRKCMYRISPDQSTADYTLKLDIDSASIVVLMNLTSESFSAPMPGYGAISVHKNKNGIKSGKAYSAIRYRLQDKNGKVITEGRLISELPVQSSAEAGVYVPGLYTFSSVNAAAVAGLSDVLAKNFDELITILNSSLTE